MVLIICVVGFNSKKNLNKGIAQLFRQASVNGKCVRREFLNICNFNYNSCNNESQQKRYCMLANVIHSLPILQILANIII
jgi:hypothetical protein